MTVEEALENTFICTRLPGGYARLPYETCIARQEVKQKRCSDGSNVKFFACLDCAQGRENIKIWEEKKKMPQTSKEKRGFCQWCGRTDMSFVRKYDGKSACGFCWNNLHKFIKEGMPENELWDRCHEELKVEAARLNGAHGKRIDWKCLQAWKDQQEQKGMGDPAPTEKETPLLIVNGIIVYGNCQCEECPYFDLSFDGHCAKYEGEASAESCETYSPIPRSGPINHDLTEPVQEEQTAPMHDMGYPAPTLHDKERISARMKAEHELQKGLALSLASESRSIPPDPDNTRYLIIDLHSEEAIAEWLRRKAKVNRRSYLVDQVLAILDNNMAADHEMDGRAV